MLAVRCQAQIHTKHAVRASDAIAELQRPAPSWSLIEQYLAHCIAQRDTQQLRELQDRVVRSPTTTLGALQLLMRGCAMDARTDDAIALFGTVAARGPPTRETMSIHSEIYYHLFKAFCASRDFLSLIPLSRVWAQIAPTVTAAAPPELWYFSAHINVLINTGQVELALETFQQAFRELQKDHAPSDVLVTLPTVRLLDLLAADKNCADLFAVLELLIVHLGAHLTPGNWFLLPYANWLTYLSVGLAHNSYALVKLVYDNIIMRGYQDAAITAENVIFDSSQVQNVLLNSVTDELIILVLHTLALHGDVALTLALIESHFLHKRMKGEQTLTKELCVYILESYCFSPDLLTGWDEAQPDSRDHSVEKVLDVLGQLMSRLERSRKTTIHYTDISDCMSFKFRNLKVPETPTPRNAATAEADSLPPKTSNPNVSTSPKGNVLANMTTLTRFVVSHIEYLMREQSLAQTITLFVNCVLNHVNLYQNLSGVIRVLTNLQQLNEKMKDEWLDADLINIILNAASKSSAAKYVAFELYNFLRATNTIPTSDQYLWLTNSVLRDDFYECLQFFVFHALMDHQVVDPRLVALLNDLPEAAILADEKTAKLCQFLRALPLRTKDEVDRYWTECNLCKTQPHISGKPVPEVGRKYYKQIDLRDVKYLRFILNN